MNLLVCLVMITGIASAQTLISGTTGHTPTSYSLERVEADYPAPPPEDGFLTSSFWNLTMTAFGSCTPSRTLFAYAHTYGVCTLPWAYKGTEWIDYTSAGIQANTLAQGVTFPVPYFHVGLSRSVRLCDGFVFGSEEDEFDC